VCRRKALCEALTGAQAGRVLSCGIITFGVLTPFGEAEGHIKGDDTREPPMNPAQSQTPGMFWKFQCARTGRPPLVSGSSSGSAGEGDQLYDQHARQWGVGRTGSTAKRSNNEENPRGEREGSCIDQGNTEEAHTCRTQGGNTCPGTRRVAGSSRRDKKQKFTALLHHVTIDLLRDSYYSLKRKAAPGVDGVTWEQYGEGMEEQVKDLHDRIHRGAYRGPTVEEKYIPKADAGNGPLGIAALEDKIVQQAVVTVLNEIYEEDFLGFSYGFRPGRRPHDALDALWVGLKRRRVNWVLDLDVRGFFDNVSHEWLVKFVEHRIADRRIIRPDPEMAEGGGVGRRGVDGDQGRNAARGSSLAFASQHLPALCLRSLGEPVAAESGARGRDCGPLR